MAPIRTHVVVDRFWPRARGLRQHFEQRFADPHRATSDRFVWDLWHVPGQYTALRTPAYTFFPKRDYGAFHQALAWWGRRTLGCHDVSPPWLSCYVNGCEQRWHSDVPHGPFAFVFSLTPTPKRFHGGQTLVLRPDVLDFWRHFGAPRRAFEEPQVLDEVEPAFNRLTVFDPRLPHAVRRVDGTLEPRDGRLVIHGWFVQPRPFIEGPVRQAELARELGRVDDAVGGALGDGLEPDGVLSLALQVAPSGRVRGLSVLVDTVRAVAEAEGARKRLIHAVVAAARGLRFRPRAQPSRITLPVVFERRAG